MSEPSVVAATSIALPEIEPDALRQIRRLRDIAPLAAPLSRSWRRCLDDYALLPEAAPEPLVHDALHVRERQQRLGDVLRIAKVEMENLYEQIAGSGYDQNPIFSGMKTCYMYCICVVTFKSVIIKRKG